MSSISNVSIYALCLFCISVSMVVKLVLMANIGAKVLPNDAGSDDLGKCSRLLNYMKVNKGKNQDEMQS